LFLDQLPAPHDNQGQVGDAELLRHADLAYLGQRDASAAREESASDQNIHKARPAHLVLSHYDSRAGIDDPAEDSSCNVVLAAQFASGLSAV
jgi:hypothetical protein